MCPGWVQVGAAGGSSGVSQDQFWHWVPGLGEEFLYLWEILGLWEVLVLYELLRLWELLGLSEFLGLWELLDVGAPGCAGTCEFLGALGSEGAFRFHGDSGFLRTPGFALSLELSDSPSPVQGAEAGSCLCFSLTTTDLKIKTGEIP